MPSAILQTARRSAQVDIWHPLLQYAFALSELYAMQQIYLDLGWQLTQAIMTGSAMAAVQNGEIEDGSFNRQSISHFELVLSVETALVQRYQRVLEMLDSTTAAGE